MTSRWCVGRVVDSTVSNIDSSYLSNQIKKAESSLQRLEKRRNENSIHGDGRCGGQPREGDECIRDFQSSVFDGCGVTGDDNVSETTGAEVGGVRELSTGGTCIPSLQEEKQQQVEQQIHKHNASAPTQRRQALEYPENILARLDNLNIKLEYLSIGRNFACWEEGKENHHRERDDGDTSIIATVEDCRFVSSLLLRMRCCHPRSVDAQEQHDGEDTGQKRKEAKEMEAIRAQLCIRLTNKYNQALHSVIRSQSRLGFSNCLKGTGYPSQHGCLTADDVLRRNASCTGGEEQSNEDGNDDREKMEKIDLVYFARNLITLQMIHERHLLYALPSLSRTHMSWKRMDIIDELFRPVVMRVKYHFTSCVNREDRVGGEVADDNVLCKRYDRLSEWLLSYLKDVALSEPFDLIRRWINPMFHHLWIEHCQMEMEEEKEGKKQRQCLEDEPLSHPPMTSSTPTPPPAAPPSLYFLREIVLLARHVLRGRSSGGGNGGGAKANVLCTILSDDILLGREMEHMLRFDAYILSLALGLEDGLDKDEEPAWIVTTDNEELEDFLNRFQLFLMNHGGGSGFDLPKVSGIVTNHPHRYQRWLEMEYDVASSALRSVLREDNQAQTEIGEGAKEKTVDANDKSFSSKIVRPLLDPATEMVLTLLDSANAKCRAGLFPTSSLSSSSSFSLLSQYMNEIHVTLSMHYLDHIHSKGKTHLQNFLSAINQMMRPRRTAWGDTLSGNNIFANLERKIRYYVQDLCRLICGTKCISFSLFREAKYWEKVESLIDQQLLSVGLSHNHNAVVEGQQKRESCASHILVRMGKSMKRISDAMLDEFVKSVIERIIVEDVQVASYLMRVHHALEGEEHETDDIDGKNKRKHGEEKEPGSTCVSRKVEEEHRSLLSVQSEATSSSCRGEVSVEDDNVVSTELVDCISVLWTIVDTLQRETKLGSGSESSVIRERLSKALASKLIDVALDIPVIRNQKEARQFRTDMLAFAHLFKTNPPSPQITNSNTLADDVFPTTARDESCPPSSSSFFDRLVDIVNLMTLERSRALSLRSVLRDLVGGQRDGLGADGNGDLDAEDEYYLYIDLVEVVDDKIMVEATSMMHARGYYYMDLRDAWVVLNRRKL